MYELIYSRAAFVDEFAENDYAELLTEIQNGKRPVIPATNNEDSHIMEKLVNLITTCWSNNPNNRPHFEKIIDTLDNIYSELMN